MKRSILLCSGGWVALTAVALAASVPSEPASQVAGRPVAAMSSELALDALADLREFVVPTDRKGPLCLYGEVPGIQILSLCSERETKYFVEDLQLQRFLLGQVFPAEFRAQFTAPLLFILKPRVASTRPSPNTGASAGLEIVVESVGATAAGTRDPDVIAVMHPFQPNSGAGPGGPGYAAFPVAAYLNGAAAALPTWTRADLAGLLGRYRVVRGALELPRAILRPGARAWPSVGDFFHLEPARWVAGRPAAQPAAGSGSGPVPVPALRLEFAQWALARDAKRAEAYWRFVRRSESEPVTEALFEECFGLSYSAMQGEIGRAATAARSGPAGAIRLPVAKPPAFPPVVLHPVTPGELVRVKAQWKRLVAGLPSSIRFRPNAEWRRRKFDEVVRDLSAVYAQGERDPQLLAELALAACDAGQEDLARRLLETLVQARFARPRVYYELGRLKYQAVRAASRGSNGQLDSDQVAEVLSPLLVARGFIPVPENIYLLIADVLARSVEAPRADALAILEEAVRRFPQRVELARRVADLRAWPLRPAGDSAGAGEGAELLRANENARAAIRRATETRLASLDLRSLRTPASSIQLRPESRAAYRPPRTGDYVFNLLPKSLQRNPLLDMTVTTVFTDHGRLIRPATPQDPAYYVMQSAGFQQRGDQVGGEHSPPADRMELVLKSALAANGYLPASTPNHAPSLVIVYHWGTHNVPLPPANPMLAREASWERHVLVTGGLPSSSDWSKAEYLAEQAADDLYFAVASAYDYRQLAQGNRKLVWRTNMTVNSRGVAMTETLPPLIASAAPFFGREMAEPELTSRRISRGGRVEIGPLSVVKENETKNAPPPGAPPASPVKP